MKDDEYLKIIETIRQSEKLVTQCEERIKEIKERLEKNDERIGKNCYKIIMIDRNTRILTEKLNEIEKMSEKIIKSFENKIIVDKTEQKIHDKQKALVLGFFGFIVTVLGLVLPNLEQIKKFLQ